MQIRGRASLALCFLTVVACGESSDSGETPGYQASFAEHPCAFDLPDGLTADDFRCGTLTTALDRENPDERTVDVEAAVLFARSPEAEESPFLFFGGGPGVYSLDNYLQAQATGALAPINEARDVVFFDPRGLGRSRPSLACPELTDSLLDAYTRDQSGIQDAENGWLAGYRACYDRLGEEGVDPSHHHSAAIAQDASDLMEALGYQTYHVYGISYGARLVQVMLRDQPEGILSAVLDSPVLVEESFGTQWAPNFQRSLDLLFAECDASATCRLSNPNLEETFYQIIADLNESPRPFGVETPSGTRTLSITGDRFAVGLANGLYQADLIPLLPVAISVTASGSDLSIGQIAPSLVEGLRNFDHGHYASVLCAEEIPFDTVEALAEAEQGVREELVDSWGAVNGPLFLDLCEFWEVDTRPSIERQPVESDIPTLVLSGQYDPATPPSYGERVASNLANSQFLLFNGVGHGVLRSRTQETDTPRCAQRIVVEFLENPSAPVDGSCARELQSPF